MKKGDIVYIEWKDITTALSTAERPKLIDAVSVGRVAYIDKEEIKIDYAWYVDGDEWPEIDGTAIPRGCIKKSRILK